jgi:hypothetical protein
METVEAIKPKEYTDAIPITNEWFSTRCMTLVMRVVNLLVNGRPFKFANTAQYQDVSGWITLGSFNVK